MRIDRRVCALFVGIVAIGGCATDPGDLSSDDLSSVDQDVLGPPSGVTVSATEPDRATVSWSAVTGAVKYYVYEATNSAGPYTFINTVRAPGTSLDVAQLTAGTNYCFEVRTDDGTGPDGFSTPACTTPTNVVAPNSTVVSQTSPTQVTVQWTSVPNTSKYYLYQSSTLTGTYSYYKTVLAPTTSYVLNNASTTTTCFKVARADANGYISSQTAGHCNTSLQPPTNVTATKTSTGRIRIDWTGGVTGATKYYVYESKAGGPLTLVASVLASSSPTTTRANLTPGTQYCYQLKTQGSPTSNVSPYSVQPACATP